MSFKIIFHFPTHLSTCKTHGLFTCFLNVYFCTFNHWWCVLILFVIVSFFFFQDWWRTGTPQMLQNAGITRILGSVPFLIVPAMLVAPLVLLNPELMFVEKVVVRPELLSWGLTGTSKLITYLEFRVAFPYMHKCCVHRHQFLSDISLPCCFVSKHWIVILHNHHSFLQLQWLSIINKPH